MTFMQESWKIANTVIEKEDVETNPSNGQRVDMKEELDKLKKTSK